MRKLLLFFLLITLMTMVKGADLNCSVVATGSCTNTEVLYLENDSGGYQNAHAENSSEANYAYNVCCDADAVGATVTTTCEGVVFLKLSAATNAHVEENTQTNYDEESCINTDTTNVTCRYGTSCYGNESCLVSYESSEGSNQTNAHIADCDTYTNLVCCGLANAAPDNPTTVTINSTELTNHTNETISCSFTPSDPDNGEDDLTCNFRWYKDNDNVLNFTNLDCTNGTLTRNNLGEGNTTKGDVWKCGVQVNDQIINSSWVNSTTLTIINSPPTIVSIEFNGTLSIIENNTRNYTISFLANDTDGITDLQGNMQEVTANLTRGITTRSNTTCAYEGDVNGFSNYSCTISIWFYDPAGAYQVSALVKDADGKGVQNNTWSFLQESTSMSVEPISTNFGTIYLDSYNNTATDDPTILTNIGNDPIADGSIKVKATGLWGTENENHTIPASNFTTDIETGGSCSGSSCIECDGIIMNNNTAESITGATLPIGASATEELYFCLMHTPANILQQSYNTLSGQEWIISIE